MTASHVRRNHARIAALAALASGGLALAQPIDFHALNRELRFEAMQSLSEVGLDPTRSTIPFSEARLFFEFNSTDEDLGIHFAIDTSKGWERVMIFYPNGRRFMDVKPGGTERSNGVTGLFSESAEPGFEDVPMDEFLRMFPEGTYILLGWATDGDVFFSEATLTHDLPAGPELLAPEEDAVVDASQPLEIRWEGVDDPDAPESVIIAYQVIVTKEEPGERKQSLEMELPPDVRRVLIPAEFFKPGKQYKYEVLARESNGNQTISELPFRTAE